MKYDDLLDTKEGLTLAHVAWLEGVSAALQAVHESDATGKYKKPTSPYFQPLAAKKRGEEELCAACGKPATGYAMIDDKRYCHPDYGRSCYIEGEK